MKNALSACSVLSILILFLLNAGTSFGQAQRTIWLTSLDLEKMHQTSGKPKIYTDTSRASMSIANQPFKNGLGTTAKSLIWLEVKKGVQQFAASVGIDDSSNKENAANYNFQVFGDGRKLWESGPMKYGDRAKKIEVDVHDVQLLLLMVVSAENSRHIQGDWAEARFVGTGSVPVVTGPPAEETVILTPKPRAAPRINGPKLYGCRPGSPFLYRIPATGIRPMKFSSGNLPTGLKLDPASGIITGSLEKRGEYNVVLKSENDSGRDSRNLKIVCGDKLALTPPMGWNDWYAHYDRITDRMMREAADILISTGMADLGYDYVNIDDCWMNAEKHQDSGRIGPARDKSGNILPNSYFPDMKGLTDYIHGKGLKAGIYTSPGPATCAGFTGSYRHEAQDVRQFANWGFDFLKYDFCSYGKVLGSKPYTSEMHQKPYRLVGSFLKNQKRDIIYNLCQYGMDSVWQWGAKVGGQSWRTAGDLGFGLDGIFEVALKNAEIGRWNKPGEWNDPDYLQIGYVGSAFQTGLPEMTSLTPTEQYSFMSLWCLLAAPLIYSGDLTKLNDFTLNILCNPEVIDINQDPLGKCATVVTLSENTFIMIKNMEDGSRAIGLCNKGEWPENITARWTDLNIEPTQRLRDVWRQQDLGSFQNDFSTSVPRHGIVLLRTASEKK